MFRALRFRPYLAAPDLIGNQWCKIVEKVLVESDQVRSESDDVGPDAELDHWKERMARFGMVTDQLRMPCCRAAIMTLHQAHSKVYRTWYKFDARITDAYNEAKVWAYGRLIDRGEGGARWTSSKTKRWFCSTLPMLGRVSSLPKGMDHPVVAALLHVRYCGC